jgi:hypothetical protein
MTVARSVADVLTDHVVFEVECIDRMYLNVYVPQLQYEAGLVGFVHRQLGLPIASTAPLAPISDGFGTAMRRFARDQGVPWIDFVKGQRKDDIMHEHLANFTAQQGVLFIGRAQEKTVLFRTEKRRNAAGVAYPWIVKTTGVVNHFYVYAVDTDFGPFFLKFCSYFPYNARLCINGHEWTKRRAEKEGIAFTALDNGFATVEDPARLQALCDELGPVQIQALLDKWLAILPGALSDADRDAGYRYELSILQGRVLPDPGARPARLRTDLFRTRHPRQPRRRPPGPGQPHLRPADQAEKTTSHPRPVPHSGNYRGGHPECVHRLQTHRNQAVPQTRKSAAHRDNHQQHP